MIYLDSCILIYLLEAVPDTRRSVARAIRQRRGDVFCFSPLSRLECLVMPVREADADLVDRYERLFSRLTCLDITAERYDEACQLRAHHALKTPDALHLATAEHHGCTEFWTNDLRLSKAARQINFQVLP